MTSTDSTPRAAQISTARSPGERRVEAVRDRPRDERDGLPGREAFVQGGRALRLDGDDPTVGERGRDAADEPAAAHRDDDDLHVREVLGDLEADRSLAGHDERVVERVHEHPAGRLLQLAEALEDLGRPRGLLVHRGPVAQGRGTLLLARALPHDHEAVDPLERAAVRERPGVVAGRGRDHAARALLGRERRELGEDAARLEAARLLEELGLQERAAAERLPEGLRREEWRPVQAAGDRGRSRSYIRLYSGPSPPSGGVSRPPLAVIAPHWTQLDAVTSTSTTLPAGLASPATS